MWLRCIPLQVCSRGKGHPLLAAHPTRFQIFGRGLIHLLLIDPRVSNPICSRGRAHPLADRELGLAPEQQSSSVNSEMPRSDEQDVINSNAPQVSGTDPSRAVNYSLQEDGYHREVMIENRQAFPDLYDEVGQNVS